jgi:hypothetical protein
MKVTRVYTGADGESHFEEIEVDIEKLQPGDGIVFRHAAPGDVNEWHMAPRRQYVINLSGQSEVEIGDGTKRRLVPAISFWRTTPPAAVIFRESLVPSRAFL